MTIIRAVWMVMAGFVPAIPHVWRCAFLCALQ
jgi:hypothetical protein